MFEPITTAQTYITPDNATTEIPRVINATIQQRRPVHIHLPIDVALTEIEISNPFKPEVEPQKTFKVISIWFKTNLNRHHNLSLLQAMK